jgi:hypothetical protein
MKPSAVLIIVLAVLVSCIPQTSPTPELPTLPSPRITSVPPTTHTDTFVVDAWVNNPYPPINSRVIVWGSLIKNGVHLGGIMMQATWPDETQEVGIPNCSVLVIYGSGVCVIDDIDYPAGEFVPITVSFEYGGNEFVGQTGFTPY